MTEPEPTTGPADPAAPVPRRRPMSRTDTAVNGALAGVLLVAGLALGGGDPVDALAEPTVTADPVRVGPLVRSLPPGCGVSRATLEVLVPHPELRHADATTAAACAWSAADDEKGRRLRVSIALYTDSRQATVGIPAATPVTEAMGAFATTTAQWKDGRLRAVLGLGDQARAFYSPRDTTGGGSIVARAGNAVVQVTYSASEDVSRTQLPERPAVDGALRTAAEAVRGLGVSVNQPPRVTDLATGTAPAGPARGPCDSVSATTVEQLLARAEREDSTERGAGPDGGQTATCKWTDDQGGDNHIYYLQVALTTYPGVASARDGYLVKHLTARAEEPISATGEKYFAALAGLGEQAYASFTAEGRPGGVVFRVGAVVATVSYSQDEVANAPPGDSEPLTRAESINGAYAVARDVASALT